MIGKWLSAGVVDGKTLTYPDKGTPQGGVISPLLSNIFLHHVLDDWFVRDVQPRMSGRCFLIRFADDFVIGFELERDALRVMEVMPKRFGRFGLAIHPEKTKLIRFSRPPSRAKSAKWNGTFDFLGLTHFWAKSRKGYWIIKWKTMRNRLCRFLKTIWQWCRINRHKPLKEQHAVLCSKLRGHFQYYGVRHNFRALRIVLHEVRRTWKYWLSKRSHRGTKNWNVFIRFLDKQMPLPLPKIIHHI